MDWTAIVPLKQGPDVKSRLSGGLSRQQREALVRGMVRHALRCLERTAVVGRVLILSKSPEMAIGQEWCPARGEGLNEDLEAARASLVGVPLLVVHGDLPFLKADDIEALLSAASRHTVALAPDRSGAGTNALALSGGTEFKFQFGADSFHKHLRSAGPTGKIVRRTGLAFDIDTPEDLAEARKQGLPKHLNSLLTG